MRRAVEDTFRKLAREGNYSPEAFRFLFEALEHALVLSGKDQAEGSGRHISGEELLAGMRQYARQIFGPLAASTWRSWGIRESMDWGRIVFLLVDAGMLNRQDSDTIEDFKSDFDFEEFFVESYRPDLENGVED